jgi:hypothetical protein
LWILVIFHYFLLKLIIMILLCFYHIINKILFN